MNDILKWIIETNKNSAKVIANIGEYCVEDIISTTEQLISALKMGNKILWCGNGGSAGQAQHLSTELVGGLRSHKREALASISLTTDTSFLTAWSNDVGYDAVFSRQIEAIGSPGDVLVALSTSGNSINIINAIKTALRNNIFTIGFTGENPCEISSLCNILIRVPSKDTQRIQEGHIHVGHIICEIIEDHFVNH